MKNWDFRQRVAKVTRIIQLAVWLAAAVIAYFQAIEWAVTVGIVAIMITWFNNLLTKWDREVIERVVEKIQNPGTSPEDAAIANFLKDLF